jgi:L-aspartate oxidase
LGLHGANRLASNSLLDGLVFGYRAAKAALSRSTPFTKLQVDQEQASIKTVSSLSRSKLQSIMWKCAGMLRSQLSIDEALEELEPHALQCLSTNHPSETDNLILNALLTCRAIAARKESRGCHYRVDFPNTDNLAWRRHIELRRDHEQIRVSV